MTLECYTTAVPDDLELLTAWRDGDRVAGDALIGRHFDSICRFFRRKLGDDVQDIIQRTFLDCVESRDRIQGSFRGYLFGIARNRLAMFLRTRSRSGVDPDLSVSSIVDFRTTASQLVARSQEQSFLLQAMQQVSVDQQIILELSYWEDLTGAEIAHVLEIEANTVRSRLSRARAALRTEVLSLSTKTGLHILNDASPNASSNDASFEHLLRHA